MNILVSNDDGIEAKGLHFLAEGLKTLGTVTVVAPQRERSTSGHSLTLHKPLRVGETKPGYFWVSGTPADCVYFASRLIMHTKPDIVVSGINRGANLGNDIFYSGTVAAAREGVYAGSPAFAVSLCLQPHTKEFFWDTAVQAALEVIPKIYKMKLGTDHLININVPNIPYSHLKGIKITRQGRRYFEDIIHERTDPRHRKYYWLGGQYKGFDPIPNSDCVAIDQGYVSVSPLKLDTTHDKLMGELESCEKTF